jgi:hypothetical protein
MALFAQAVEGLARRVRISEDVGQRRATVRDEGCEETKLDKIDDASASWPSMWTSRRWPRRSMPRCLGLVANAVGARHFRPS